MENIFLEGKSNFLEQRITKCRETGIEIAQEGQCTFTTNGNFENPISFTLVAIMLHNWLEKKRYSTDVLVVKRWLLYLLSASRCCMNSLVSKMVLEGYNEQSIGDVVANH